MLYFTYDMIEIVLCRLYTRVVCTYAEEEDNKATQVEVQNNEKANL